MTATFTRHPAWYRFSAALTGKSGLATKLDNGRFWVRLEGGEFLAGPEHVRIENETEFTEDPQAQDM